MKNVQGFIVRNPLRVELQFLGILEGEGELLGASGLGLALGYDEPEGDVGSHLLPVVHFKFVSREIRIQFFHLFEKISLLSTIYRRVFRLPWFVYKKEINLVDF